MRTQLSLKLRKRLKLTTHKNDFKLSFNLSFQVRSAGGSDAADNGVGGRHSSEAEEDYDRLTGRSPRRRCSTHPPSRRRPHHRSTPRQHESADTPVLRGGAERPGPGGGASEEGPTVFASGLLSSPQFLGTEFIY